MKAHRKRDVKWGSKILQDCLLGRITATEAVARAYAQLNPTTTLIPREYRSHVEGDFKWTAQMRKLERERKRAKKAAKHEHSPDSRSSSNRGTNPNGSTDH